jgi:hypothetical protein
MTAMTVAPALADEPHAPPMLTPSAAADIALACPEAKGAATALVAGVTLVQANAAVPLLARCADAPRLPNVRWKNAYATVGLAAAELSRAILTHDTALFKRVADVTSMARAASPASDDQVRAWSVIPDVFDERTNQAVYATDSCGGDIIQNAAYLNLAARSGTAWIAAPRTVPHTCVAQVTPPAGSIIATWGTSVLAPSVANQGDLSNAPIMAPVETRSH